MQMMQLKKVINQYKFDRVRANKRTFTCKVYIDRGGIPVVPERVTGFLLADHLYIPKAVGVYPHTKFEFYDYYIGEIGGVHYRKDRVAFYKLYLTNKI